MALAFFGTAPFGASILEGLLERREVALVVSQPDRPSGRGKQLQPTPVARVALDRGVRLVQPERTHAPELLELYRELGIDTIVVAAFGQMIREPLLSDFIMLNVHGSLLPAWRGAAPVERSIMAGELETGVCIMQMEAGLDTGPVARTSRVPISARDDAGDVFAALAVAGIEDLHDALDAAAEGTLDFIAQPAEGATYAHKVEAVDRVIDLARTARQVHDQVRGLSPHIGAHLSIDGQRLGIWRTQPVDHQVAPGQLVHDGATLLLGASDGALEVLELQPPSKRRMTASDWLRGLREPLRVIDAPVHASTPGES